MAAQENHGEVVKYLLAHNANQNLATEGGFLPLEVATQQGHYKIVETLLQHQSRPKYPPKQEDGYTPLAVALQQGHDKVVAVLLENDRAGKTRLPALHICSRRDDTKAALLLLQSGHNPDITSKSGFTPLHIAAHYGHVNVATLLLQRGASVDHAARNNITPLHVAAKWGRVNMVNTLLDRGARIDAKTRDGLTPLHCSARSGHDQCVDQLLERGAPISAKTKNGLAPLHMAAQGDHVDSARLLLYHKAPVDDVTVDYLTPLHVAAHCGHHRVAKLLLDRKANPSARALNGFTPLHIACKKNRVKVIELLLKYGASIHATTESGLTPLHVASFMGNINIVGYLINHGASVDETNVRGETALHLAARANQIDIIRVLLRNGAKVDARAAENQTPLHIAARLGNVEIVTLLLENGASPDAQTRDHYTALHIAAREGKEDVAAVLLDHGASLSMQTKKEFTPLHVAAKYGRLGVASLLLKHYAAPDATAQNGLTPLHIAAHYDNVEVAMLLLDQGASPHTVAQNGFTPLHIAAKKNQLDVATTLLEYGADPNCMTKQGISPIHLAAQEGHTDMLSLLLERGAKPDIAAKNGLTPLHLAAQEDQLDCAKVLVKNGSGIDPRTKAGYTPLHVACHYGNLKTAAYLLQNGAAIQAKTKHGLTPLHQASQQGHVAIINLLLTKGADPNETANNGYTALAIAKRFGYISVVNTLTTVTTVETTIVQSPTDEKLKVQVPETMVISFMSDNEDEELGSPADDISMTGDNSLLTPQEIKTMGDDSMPIANRKSWEEEWMSGEPNLRYYSGSDSLSGRYSTPQSGKYRGAMLSPQGFDSRASTLNRDIPLSEAEESFVDGGEVISRTTEITVESAAPLMSSSPAMRHTLNVTTPDGKRVSVGDPYIDEDGKLLEGMVYGQDGRPVSAALSDNAPLSSIPIFAGFLISFMVDARGGTMKSCRLPGLRVVIPPKRASGPTRVTCRLIKKSKLTTPPPLLENETLATRVLEVGPSNTQFLGGLGNKLIHSPPLNDGEQLVNGIMEFGPPAEKFIGPVLIEVPHFASLRGKEREIVILRSEKGDTWKEHSLDAKDTEVHKALEGYEGDDDNNVNSDRRICRILTNDFPQYFAIISRVRQETNTIGTSGGMLSSTVVPQVQAVFPEGTLTKKIKVGLQAQPVGNEVVKKVLGNRVMVSPIVTIEPRRRKFHKAITVTIPIPNNQGIINGYGGDTPTLRLLCSITGGTAPAQWEDITGTTPLTFVDNCVSFTTTVSARFWLMDCKEIDQASNFARELYHELKAVPFMARFAIYAKTHDPIESRVRVYCVTDDRTDKTLEQQEHFKEVARSKDVEVLESKPIYIEMAGNLVPVQKSGDQLHLVFSPFHENRLPFFVRVRDSATEPCGRLSFMSEPKVTRGMPPQKALCNLNITMPPFVKVKRPSESESESESSEEREQYSQQKEGKTTITQIYSLTRVDEYPKDEAASNLNFASIKLRKKYTFLQDPAMSPTSAHARAEIRLMQVAKEIGTDWRALGRQLGVSEKDLQEIENENDEIEEQAFVMLHAWAEDAKENATTDKLSDALHEIGRGDVANKCLADYAVMDVSIDREEDTSDFLRDMERAMYEASLKHDEDKHKPGVTIDITGDDGGAFRELQDEIEADKDLDSYSGKIVKEVHRTVTTRTEVRTERRVPSDIETAVKEQAKDEVAESLIKELKEEAIAAGIPEDAGAAELYEEMKEEILEKHEEERREMQFEPTVDVLEESQEEDGQTPTETKALPGDATQTFPTRTVVVEQTHIVRTQAVADGHQDGPVESESESSAETEVYTGPDEVQTKISTTTTVTEKYSYTEKHAPVRIEVDEVPDRKSDPDIDEYMVVTSQPDEIVEVTKTAEEEGINPHYEAGPDSVSEEIITTDKVPEVEGINPHYEMEPDSVEEPPISTTSESTVQGINPDLICEPEPLDDSARICGPDVTDTKYSINHGAQAFDESPISPPGQEVGVISTYTTSFHQVTVRTGLESSPETDRSESDFPHGPASEVTIAESATQPRRQPSTPLESYAESLAAQLLHDVKEELQQPEQKPKEKLVEQVEAKTRRGGESVPEAPQEREEPSVEPALSSEPEVAVYGTTVFREERITTTKVTKTMRTTDGGISVPDVAEVTTSVVFQSKDAPVEPVEVSPEEKEGNVQEEALVAEKVALEEAEKKVVVVEEEAEKPPEEPSEDIVEEIPEELRDVKEERVKQPDVTKEPEVKPEEDVRIEEIPDDIPAKRVAETEGPPQTEADVLVQTTIHKTETVVHREVIHITSTAEEEPEEIQEDRSPEPQADVEVEEDKVEAAVVEVTPEVPLEEEETEKDDTTVEEEQELQEEPVLEEEGIEEEAAPEEEVAPQVLPAEEITPEETYTELDQEPLKEIVMEEERIEEMAALEEVSRKAVSEEEIAPEAAFGEPEEQRREEEVVGEQGFEEETGPGEVAPDVALEEEEAAPEEIYEEPEKELKEEGVVEEEALKEEVAPEEEIVPEVLSERKVTEPEEIDQEPQEVSMEEKHAEAVVPVDVAQHIPEEDKMQVHTETHISVQQTIVKSTVTYFHEEARTSDEEAPGAAALPVKEDIKNEEEVLTELEPAVEAEEGIEEKATEICLQGAEVKREEEIVQEITYEEPEPVQEEVIMEKEKIEEKSAPEVEAVPEDVWEYKKTAPQEPEEEPEEVAAAEEEVKEAAVEEVVPVAPKDTFQEPEQQPDEVVVAEEMIGEEVAPEVMLKEEETAPEEQEQEPQEEIVVKEEIAEEAAPEQEVVPEIPSDQEIQEKEGTEVEEYHKEPDRELEDVEEKMEVHTETHISAHQTIVQSSFVYGLHEEARTTEKEPSEEAMLPDKADVQKEEEPPQELEAIVREERIEEEAAPEVEVAPEILLEKDMAPEKPPEEPEQEPEEEAVAEEERIEEEPVPEAEYEEAEQEPEEEFILKEERVEEEAAPEVEVTPECLLEEKLSSKETLGEPEQEPQKEVEEERSEEDVAPEEIVPDVVPQEEEIAQERLSEGPGPELHEELVVEEGRIEEEAAPAVEEYPERDVGEPQKLEHVELARKEPMEPKQVLFSTHETIHTEKRTFVQQTIVQTTVSEVHGEREQHFLPEEPVEIMGKESDQEEVLEDVQDQEVVKVEYEQDTALAEGQEDIPDSLEEQIEDQQEPELTPEAVAEAEVGIAREIRVVEESVSVHRLVEHIEAKEQESEQPSVQYQEDVRLETMEDEEQETEQEREMEPLEKEEEEELEEIAMGVEEAEVLAEEPAEDVVEEILEEPKEEEVEEGEKATEPVTEEVVMETQKHIESEAVFRYDVDQEVAKEKPSVEEETDEVLDDIPRSPFPQLEESEEERKSEPILEDEYHLEVDEEYSADAGISEDADIEDNLIDEKQEEHEKPHIPEILDITETYSSQSYTHLREEHVAIIESPAYTPEKTPRGDDSDKEDGRHSPEIETEDRRSSLEVIQIEEKYLVETPSGEPSFRDDVEKLGIEHEIIKETETVEHTYVAPPVDLSLREEQAGLEEEAVLPPTPEITPIPDSPIESDGELKEAVYTQQEEQILEVPQDLDLQQQTEQYDTLQTPEIQELPDTPESLPEPAPHYEEDYQEDFKEELQEEPVTEDQERREDEAMEEEVQLVDGPTEQAYYDPNLLVQPAAEGIQEPLEEQEDKSETLDQQQQETPELVEEQREEDEQAREQEPKPEEEQTIEEEPKEDLQPLTPLPSPEDEAQALAQESERLESSDIQARLEEEIQEDRLLEATTIQESFYSQTIVTTEESAFILGEPAVETADSITLPGVPEPVTESEGQLPSPGDEEDSHKPPPHKLAPPPGQEVEGKDDEVDSPTKPVAVGVVGSVAVASFEEPRLQDRAPSEDSEIEDDLEEKPCEEDEGMYEEESARDEALASDEGDVDKDVVEGDAEVEMPEPQDEEEMEAEKHTDAQEFAEEEEVEGETEAMQELQDETSQEREVEELEECPLNEEPMEEEPIQEEAEIAPPDTMEQEPVSGFTESSEVTTRTVYAEVHHERVVVASSQAFVESTPEEQDQLEIQLSSSLHTEPPVDEQFDAADRPDVPEDKPRATQEDIEALAIALNEFTMPTFEDEEAPKTYEQAEGDVGEEEPIEGQDVSTEESAPPRRRPEEVGPSFLTSDDEKEIQELWDRTQELPENATLEFTTMAEAAPVVESSAPVVELAPDSDRYEGDSSPEERQFSESPLSSTSEDRQAGPPEPKTPDITDMDECPFSLKENLPKISTEPTVEFPPEVQEPGEANGDQPVQYSEQPEQEQLPSDSAVAKPVVSDPNEDVQEIVEEFEEELPDGTIRKVTRKRIIRRVMQTVEVDPNDPNFVMPQGEPDEDGVHRITVHKKTSRKTVIRDGEEVDVTEDVETNIQEDGEEVERSELREDLQRMVDQFLSEDAKAAAEVTEVKEDPEESEI
ncbi:ankyrin-2-like isoform X7 [Acanthaster planci]|uniref:Ankyrin-2-like isoform X7 n=1 Tax=Acanthaster planci TaxID=133434 RepID=A0A8B7XEL4_ACAPL|nr:ankyrin-2-like isoform X7 [Acanthaster planci]